MLKLSLQTTTKQGGNLSAMKKITQDMLHRQSILKYAKKHGVTKAATITAGTKSVITLSLSGKTLPFLHLPYRLCLENTASSECGIRFI